VPSSEWNDTTKVPRELADYINCGENIGLCGVCHTKYGATRKVYRVVGHDVPVWYCDRCL